MKRTIPSVVLAALTLTVFESAAVADEPVTLENPITLDNFVAPAANSPDEPLAKSFSIQSATAFLDSAALDWQKSRQCMTCHTNYAYLMARPSIGSDVPAHAAVREYAEKLVTERWPDSGPRWDAEVVMTALVLAFNDAATTGKLHPTTRVALDRMWTVQREDGCWSWIKCGWAPMESDDDFAIGVAALAAGIAPEGYADTPAAQAGLAKLRGYLKTTPPPTLHHRAMLLWASTVVPNLMTDAERQACIDELLALQKADGGWNLATLGDWKRHDDAPQDTETSDGYATGFVIYVLRQSGLPAGDERLAKGVHWLKSNQRASGRWFTRSLFKDSKHYISHYGTAFAVLAIKSCEGDGASTSAAGQ